MKLLYKGLFLLLLLYAMLATSSIRIHQAEIQALIYNWNNYNKFMQCIDTPSFNESLSIKSCGFKTKEDFYNSYDRISAPVLRFVDKILF